MPVTRNITCAGLQWQIKPLELHEQFEVEAILLRLFGAGMGRALGSVVEGMAETLVEVLLSTTGEGDSFDIAKILELDTADVRLAGAWDKMLAALTATLGDTLQTALPAITDRVDYRDLVRLFELAVLSKKTMVVVNGVTADVRDHKTLGGLLRHSPASKWELLSRAILVTYGREEDEAEPEAVGGDE